MNPWVIGIQKITKNKGTYILKSLLSEYKLLPIL